MLLLGKKMGLDLTALLEAIQASYGGSFVADMIDAIERGEELFIPTRDVFATAQACLQAQESARREGEFVAIPSFDL